MHSLREPLWCQLMLALARSGHPAEALAACAEVHEVLRRNLGVEPGPDLKSLRGRLLEQKALPADA